MPFILRRCWVAYLMVFCVLLGLQPSVITAQDKEKVKTKFLDMVPADYMMLMLMNRTDRMLDVMQTFEPDMELDFEKESLTGKTGLDVEAGQLVIFSAPEEVDDLLRVVEVFKLKDKAHFMERHKVKENQDGALEGMDTQGAQAYLRFFDGYVMFSDDQLYLLNLKPGKMGAKILEELKSSPLEKMDSYHALGQMNIKNTKAYLTDLMDFDEIRDQVKGGPPVQRALGTLGITLMEKWMGMLMRDTESLVLAANFSEEGMMIDAAMKFKEGSELAKLMVKQGKTPTVNRLPEMPFFFLMAGDLSEMGESELFNDFLKDLKTSLKEIEVEDQTAKELMTFYILLVDLMEDFMKESEPMQTMEMIVPAPEKIDIRNAFASLTVMTIEKPDQYMDAYAKLVQRMKKGLDELSLGDQMIMEFQRNLTEVNGKPVSVLHMAPKAQGMNPAGNMNKRHIVPGKDAVLEMNGGDFSLLAKGIKAMDGGSGLEKTELVQLMKKESMPDANVMGILNTQKLTDALMGFVGSMMGQQAPRVDGLKPMIFSTSQGKGWMKARSTVPMKSFHKVQKSMEAMQQGAFGPGAM